GGELVLEDVLAERSQFVRRHAREKLGGGMDRENVAPRRRACGRIIGFGRGHAATPLVWATGEIEKARLASQAASVAAACPRCRRHSAAASWLISVREPTCMTVGPHFSRRIL